MKLTWTPIRKIVAAALSGLTTTGVMALLDGVGVHIDQALAGGIVGLAAVAVGYLVPSPQG